MSHMTMIPWPPALSLGSLKGQCPLVCCKMSMKNFRLLPWVVEVWIPSIQTRRFTRRPHRKTSQGAKYHQTWHCTHQLTLQLRWFTKNVLYLSVPDWKDTALFVLRCILCWVLCWRFMCSQQTTARLTRALDTGPELIYCWPCPSVFTCGVADRSISPQFCLLFFFFRTIVKYCDCTMHQLTISSVYERIPNFSHSIHESQILVIQIMNP